jgi:hypothetical protein
VKIGSSTLEGSPLQFDFRNIDWGMTKEEVKTTETGSPNSEGEDYITYRDNVMGLDAIVGYHFSNDSLVEAGYAFRDKYESVDVYIKQYENIKEALDNIHGQAPIDKDLDCKTEHTPGKDGNSVMLLSEWLTQRSVIRLVLMGQGGDCDFGLLHKSMDHALLMDAKYGIVGEES